MLSPQHHGHSHLLSWKAVGSQDVPENTVNALDFEALLNQILSSNDLQALRTFTENNNSLLGPTRYDATLLSLPSFGPGSFSLGQLLTSACRRYNCLSRNTRCFV